MARRTLDSEQVVDAAAELADRDGIEAVTLTAVADVLGVKQPALYRHVEGYDDLVRSLGLRGRELLAAALADAVMGVAGPDAVRALGRAWRAAAQAHPGLYAATDRYPCAGDPELEAAVERIVGIIAAALQSFELSDAATVHAARSLRSAFHGFVHLEGGDGHPRPDDLDTSFERLLDLLVAGVRSLEDDPDPATSSPRSPEDHP